MAKVQKKYSFSKANITVENGKYMISEIEKDGISVYNLTDILNEFLDKDGVVLTVGIDTELAGIEE